MSTEYTKKERIVLSIMLCFVLAFLLFLHFFPKYEGDLDETTAELFEMAVSRLLGGAIFLCLLIFLGYPILSFRRITARGLLLSLPALLVAVNNFPILGLLTGTVYVEAELPRILLFGVSCVGIGFFEEIAFRGVVFPVLLERIPKALAKKEWKSKRVSPETLSFLLSIVSTSAVFGLVHTLNLFAGGSLGGVLLQVGYSFLIGGMCALVLLKTRCVWLAVLIHAVYDFGGMMFTYLCNGKLWDTPTVVLTAVLGVLTAIFYVVLLLRVKPEEIQSLLRREESGS